jgi:hypothetical protein
MWYLVLGLIILGVITALFGNRKRRSPEDGETDAAGRTECCGQHEVCERESLLAAAGKEIEYYDDEELDAYRGTAPDEYRDQEIEEFREVLYTLHETEVAAWLRSLQLRDIHLPDRLKDEALLITEEQRQKLTVK